MEIDMELLRRVWDLRTAVDAWEREAGSDAPREALACVAALVEGARQGAPGLVPSLEALAGHLADTATADHPSVGLPAAVQALEEAVLVPSDEAAARALQEAVAGVRGATTDPRPQDDPATVDADGGGPLDPLASHLVLMDPEDAAQLRELAALAAVACEGEIPAAIRPHLERARELLAPFAAARRSRKADRARVVGEVSEILEQAAEALDLAEMEEGMRAEASRDAPRPPSPPARVSGDGTGRADPFPEGADLSLIQDFVSESLEYVAQSEQALLELESRPDDPEALNVVFRAFHSVKGVSGFLELGRISELAHHAETLFSRVRDGQIPFTGSVADLALRSVDQLEALLEAVTEGMDTGVIRVPAGYAALVEVLADPELEGKIGAGEVGPGGPSAGAAEDDEPAGEEGRAAAPRTDASVRVRTDRLDRLVDMVGELVIAQSMIAQDPGVVADQGGLARKVDQAAKILRELQDLSTSLRMVPLQPAIRKVSRVVRDLSRKVGKPVRLVTEGEDTEIDRTMVDVLADPLVHMVRNSMDHGLESPEERVAAGKPEHGTIRIAACQQGGNVVITVSDDGRGLNREKILARARERGLVESDRGMTDAEVFGLIFQAGFSTAERVTEVSGRGVGMDVVRRNVESLRGRVTVESTPGEGSTIAIHLPLTLAITDGMVVRVGRERYIIPSVKILMSVAPAPGMVSTVTGRGEMARLQGGLLPVLRLGRHWGIPDAADLQDGLLVVVGSGSQRAALLVDELVSQQQFVVKPLTGLVARTQGVAGGAIMGSGDVGLILDPDAIVAAALSGQAA